MACNDQLLGPCGGDGPTTTPSSKIGTIVGVIGTLIGVVTAVVGVVTASASTIATFVSVIAALGGASGAGALSGLLAVLAVIAVIAIFGFDRCQGDSGPSRCIAGVVGHIEESFDDAGQQLFPFASQHTRVDVVVKSIYWPLSQQLSATYVWCTDSSTFASVVFRCYYYTKAVCAAVEGSLIGAAVGGVAGIVGGALAAAAIVGAAGCVTIILCLFALIIAAIIAAVAAIVGAFVGGQIGKAAAGGTDTAGSIGATTDTHTTVSVGDLVSVTGHMEARDDDQGANVMWWVQHTVQHGTVSADTPQPFTHCDAEDQLPTDACGWRVDPPSTPPPPPPR